jgi:DNA-binding transcriptional MerR regulator
MAMRSKLSEPTPTPPKGQALNNIISIGRARKSADEDHDELLTANEARHELGVYEKKLYAWAAAGLVRAYRTRFTKYTLYSKADIARQTTRIVAGGSPEGEINEAKYFLGRKVKPGEEATGRANLFNMLVENIRLAAHAGDLALVDQLTAELTALASSGPPSNGGEEVNKTDSGEFGAFSAAEAA